MTLYIDTHFINLVLALLKDGKIIDKRVIESNKHSENTIPLLEEMLTFNNITCDDLESIIVITGPGSFTGVRIGVVIAKTIGYTKSIKVKGISFLQAVALKYDKGVIIGIKDKNGVFIGKFNKEHELIGDYNYLDNSALANFREDIIYDDDVDILLVEDYLKDKKEENIHDFGPLYVKRIEAQK